MMENNCFMCGAVYEPVDSDDDICAVCRDDMRHVDVNDHVSKIRSSIDALILHTYGYINGARDR